MNIGSTIKKLRRAKDMTQESLAEHLGVSVSAVSQWEAEKTAPDLSLIPPLCNLLEVTSDELLGIDLEAKQKKIREIIDKADSYKSRGYGAEAHEILSEGLREFPGSFEIMRFLMYNNFHCASDCSKSDDERNRFRDETICIAELILEKCTDDDNRQSAIQILSLIYPKIGKLNRAAELAGKMPPITISRDILYSNIYSGSKGYLYDKILLNGLVQLLSNQIVAYDRQRENGEFYYTEDDKAALRDKQIAFLTLMYEDGDMGFFHCHLISTHVEQAKYYAKREDTENTLAHLAKAAEHAIGFVKYASDVNCKNTSLLFREDESFSSFSTDSSENNALELLHWMDTPEFDFIRDKAGFGNIVDKLKVYAEKWKPVDAS